jgi:hypothetical protein
MARMPTTASTIISSIKVNPEGTAAGRRRAVKEFGHMV